MATAAVVANGSADRDDRRTDANGSAYRQLTVKRTAEAQAGTTIGYGGGSHPTLPGVLFILASDVLVILRAATPEGLALTRGDHSLFFPLRLLWCYRLCTRYYILIEASRMSPIVDLSGLNALVSERRSQHGGAHARNNGRDQQFLHGSHLLGEAKEMQS
ncbi:hypothetical protein [Pseudomonas nitroreducens]|uniref:hypothetical protein n=1 Tax=Pseudomonas nitroreducens TaxID=46680 RepID=UPI002D8079DD|nr:hypothetical protein [Pseudomonas nitroreducens]